MKVRIRNMEIDLDAPIRRVGVVDLICPRRGWWAFREPVRTMGDEMMAVGVVMHEGVLGQVSDRCEVEKRVEVSTSCGVVRRFRADAVCRDEDGGRFVVEVKKRVNPRYMPLYLWQVRVYMAFLNVERGYLLSVEDGRVYEVSSEGLEEVREVFIDNLEKAVCGVGLPGRRVGVWCRLCKYRARCFNGTLL